MEKPLLLVILLAGLTISQVIAQGNNVHTSDSLNYDSTQIDFAAYLKKLSRAADSAISRSDYRELMSIGELFKQEFGDLTTSEKNSLRYESMMMAFKISKKTGDNNTALEI